MAAACECVPEVRVAAEATEVVEVAAGLLGPHVGRPEARRHAVAYLRGVVDETGFPKQGRHSAGVARQYSGTLGKVANCQVGVFLGYATARGHVGLDRALFVPEAWAADRERCRRAGIPEAVGHRPKPRLALELIERALDAGVPAAWVTGDEVYGSDGKLRRALEGRGQAYVLAVRSNESATTWRRTGRPARSVWRTWPRPCRRRAGSG